MQQVGPDGVRAQRAGWWEQMLPGLDVALPPDPAPLPRTLVAVNPALLAKAGGCGTHLPLTLEITVLWTVPESHGEPTLWFDIFAQQPHSLLGSGIPRRGHPDPGLACALNCPLHQS